MFFVEVRFLRKVVSGRREMVCRVLEEENVEVIVILGELYNEIGNEIWVD